jgi:hypothetical protein
MRVFWCATVALALSACDPNTTPIQHDFGTSKNLLLGGNIRIVTERERSFPDGRSLPSVCTEPSPDVAIAFARSAAFTANVTVPEGPTVAATGNVSSTQTVTALAGRTAGVVALRDGLYAACQAYTNGILGHDAYAIILSQYGNLLVALTATTTPPQSPHDAAAAALLVACISEHDPTRITPVYANGMPARNELLSRRGICDTLLTRIAQGKAIRVALPATKDK